MRAYMIGDDVSELLIYEPIGKVFGTEGITGKAFAKEFNKIKTQTVDIRINSIGGDVIEAAGIYQTIKQSPKTVNMRIDGFAMSAAAVIPMAGDTIEMSPDAIMMIHRAWTLTDGNALELRAEADRLERMDETAARIFADRTDMESAEILTLLTDETWMDATEAVDMGFADSVMAEPEIRAAAAPRDLAKYFAQCHEVPSAVLERLEDDKQKRERRQAKLQEHAEIVSALQEQMKILN